MRATTPSLVGPYDVISLPTQVRKVSTVPARQLVSRRIRRYFAGCRQVDPIERTLALIKPDAVESGNAGDIIARYDQTE